MSVWFGLCSSPVVSAVSMLCPSGSACVHPPLWVPCPCYVRLVRPVFIPRCECCVHVMSVWFGLCSSPVWVLCALKYLGISPPLINSKYLNRRVFSCWTYHLPNLKIRVSTAFRLLPAVLEVVILLNRARMTTVGSITPTWTRQTMYV